MKIQSKFEFGGAADAELVGGEDGGVAHAHPNAARSFARLVSISDR